MNQDQATALLPASAITLERNVRFRQNLLILAAVLLFWTPTIGFAQTAEEPNSSGSDREADAVLDCLLAAETDNSKLSFTEQIAQCEETIDRPPDESEDFGTPPSGNERQ